MFNFLFFAHACIILSICPTLFKGLTHLIFNSSRVGTIIILNLHIRKLRHSELSDLFNITGKTKIIMYMYIILVTLLTRYIKSARQTPICSLSSGTSSFLLPFSLFFQVISLPCDLSGSRVLRHPLSLLSKHAFSPTLPGYLDCNIFPSIISASLCFHQAKQDHLP